MAKTSVEPREISQDYLNAFISSIQKGFPVTYVEGSNLLAVDHPEIGYIVLQLFDKVIVEGDENV